jgi:hypothetical protein
MQKINEERDRFIAPQQRGGGPGRCAGRLAPHFRSKPVKVMSGFDRVSPHRQIVCKCFTMNNLQHKSGQARSKGRILTLLPSTKRTPLPNPLPTSWGEGIGRLRRSSVRMRPDQSQSKWIKRCASEVGWSVGESPTRRVGLFLHNANRMHAIMTSKI